MTFWLGFARIVDELNARVARAVGWLVLIMSLVSAGNAVSRKAFNLSSNAFLEAQWYLYAAVFLLAAGATLQRNGHVRIDLITARLSLRTRLRLEIIGTVFLLVPFVSLVLHYSWPYFLDALANREVSLNAGGLPVWPVKLLIPAGFALLLLQGAAQAIKATAALRGQLSDDAVFASSPERRPDADAKR